MAAPSPVLVLRVLVLVLPTAQAMDNGLARTPPMGWSSWNGNGGPTTPAKIRQTAALLEALGLRKLG